MAVSWGTARESSTNGARVGIDLDYSVSGDTATVTFELWLWTKRASFGSSASYSRGGAWSGGGSFSYNHTNNSSDWPTSNRTRIGRWTTTRNLGTSTQTVTASGSVTGLGGNIPEPVSHSRTLTLPARNVSAPASPSGATATRLSDSQIRIQWSRNATADRPYHGQRVQRRHLTVSGWTDWVTRANLSGTATSFTDSVIPNREWQYRVQARNSAGDSGWNWTDTVHTTPSSPSSVRAAASPSGIRLTWDNTAAYAASTRLERQEGDGAWLAWQVRGAGQSEATLTDPDLLVTHRFRARHEAPTGGLVSTWTYSNRVELAAPPAAPTGLGPSARFDATEARRFTWTHVPLDGSAQARYQVRHRAQGATTWTTLAETTSTTSAWTLPADTYSNGQTVEWQVRTWGVHPDPGPWSPSGHATATARPTAAINGPVPGEIINRSAVNVQWGFNQDQGLPQTGWRVELLRDGDIVQSQSGSHATVNVVLLRGLDNNATYQVRVTVQAAGMWSLPDVVEFTTDFLPPPTPEVEVTWDVELGAAVITVQVPTPTTGEADPNHVQVWRAIGDGDWLLIADDLPLDTAITDPIPAIGDGSVNYYRATAVSTLPSTADSAAMALAVTSAQTEGWVYLNGGPGMDQVCKVRANASRSGSFGRVKELRQYAGRRSPVEHAGTAVPRTWSVSARVAPVGDSGSTVGELEELQELGGPVCYRDPMGARWFGSMGQVSDSWSHMTGEVSFSLTELDHVEGLVGGDV